MKLNFTLLTLFFVLLFISCSQTNNGNLNSSIKLNYELAYKIAQVENLSQPDTVFIGELGQNQYIAALFTTDSWDKRIKVLHHFAETWQEEDTFPILDHIVDFKFAHIDSLDYVFYAEESAGNSLGAISFTLRELNSKTNYTILFRGEIGKYDEMLPINENVKRKKSILHYLETKAASSKFVYKQNISDYDLENPSNYMKKWEILNSGLQRKLKENPRKIFDIKFPEYQNNIFTILNHGPEVLTIENTKYIIKSYHKNDVIGYDKNTNKYFVIWVPKNKFQWIEKLEFLSESFLLMTEFGSDSFNLDLKDKVILRL